MNLRNAHNGQIKNSNTEVVLLQMQLTSFLMISFAQYEAIGAPVGAMESSGTLPISLETTESNFNEESEDTLDSR